jgi:glycosyltransferase involved in cell wall biosynthesis
VVQGRNDGPKKVLYLTDNREFGGTERMLLTILQGLDRSRWEPVLVHRPGAGFEKLDEGARELSVRVWTVEEMKGSSDAAWVFRVAKRFRAERPAVFHAHRTSPIDCFYGLLAAIVARIPAIVVTHHVFAGRTSRTRELQEKMLSAGIDRYIGVSNEVARHLRPRCLFPDSKVRVIHNGISLEGYSSRENPTLRSSLTKGSQRPIVMSVARLENRQKGLQFLVSAAAEVTDAQFILVGAGPHRAELEEQVEGLGIQDRVTFLGHREDVPELLGSCDLLVLPSLFEGFGVSVLEAMAAGRPVVASAIGGVNEVVVDGETGLLVPPGDPHALAAAIRTVLADSALARRFGEAGRARSRQFSVKEMLDRTTGLYEELLDAHV